MSDKLVTDGLSSCTSSGKLLYFTKLQHTPLKCRVLTAKTIRHGKKSTKPPCSPTKSGDVKRLCEVEVCAGTHCLNAGLELF